MTDRTRCEFFVIRYVPDVVKGEFTNIGVMLRQSGQMDTTVVRFTRDWTRVRRLHADADIDLLEALEDELNLSFRSSVLGARPMLAVIQDSFSNSIQISEARACLAQNVITELELLMQMYVDHVRVKHNRKNTGRAFLTSAIRTQFERTGVWPLMRKRIDASVYTRLGDPLRVDCGYRPNGIVKMFHAVTLDGDVEAAKVLAYSASQLRDGVARVEGAKLEMTAVVEPLRTISGSSSGPDACDEEDVNNGRDERVERYRFAVETMESQEIRVITTNDLARAAETVKLDLRL